MPSVLIEVDGNLIANVDLSGMQVVDVAVHGGLNGEEKATLSAMGGNYEDGGCGQLIWINERPIAPGEVVCIKFREDCASPDHGKAIDEQYPDGPSSTAFDFAMNDEMVAELRNRPRLHDGFIIQAETSSGARAMASSDDLNTQFRFGLLWDWLHPEQARLSLRTYSFENIISRSEGAKHLEARLAWGDSTTFSVIK